TTLPSRVTRTLRKRWRFPETTANAWRARSSSFRLTSAKFWCCGNWRGVPTRRLLRLLRVRWAQSCPRWPARVGNFVYCSPSPRQRSPALSCELAQTRLHAYLDGELDAAGSADFDQHLRTCAICAAVLQEEEKLRQTLQQSRLYSRAPAGLKLRIQE